MLTALRHCPSCDMEREFEQPPCVDGHGQDCPEWLCVECGLAMVAEFDLESGEAVQFAIAHEHTAHEHQVERAA